jgi:18S rRNA (guanine1575-N7)-methyltransferase
MSRPEHIAPPEVFYDEREAGKYTSNTRIKRIQVEMAQRCVEMLLMRPGESGLILDIGCGSGLSGDVLASAGHAWVGLDVSPDMLDIAHARGCGSGGGEEGGCGELLLGDMGQGFGFRAGMFDGAISVSALQWLCYSDKRGHKSGARLEAFFSALYRSLRRGARAALQFYPESEAQLELITTSAKRVGFTGGLVVDFPQSKRLKKYYLCLISGGDSGRTGGGGAAPAARLPAPKSHLTDAMEDEGGDDDEEEEDEEEDDEEDEEEDEVEGGGEGKGELQAGAGGGGGRGASRGASVVHYEGRRGLGGASSGISARIRHKKRDAKARIKSRDWIIAKKDAQTRKGLETRPTTKYTARKRKPKF